MSTRNYESDENPEVGDVVQLFDDAFGTAIVTVISKETATLERTHMSVHDWQVQIGIERLDVSLERLRTLPVYISGKSGRIDNRASAL
jgi:hypothetical protein